MHRLHCPVGALWIALHICTHPTRAEREESRRACHTLCRTSAGDQHKSTLASLTTLKGTAEALGRSRPFVFFLLASRLVLLVLTCVNLPHKASALAFLPRALQVSWELFLTPCPWVCGHWAAALGCPVPARVHGTVPSESCQASGLSLQGPCWGLNVPVGPAFSC